MKKVHNPLSYSFFHDFNAINQSHVIVTKTPYIKSTINTRSPART